MTMRIVRSGTSPSHMTPSTPSAMIAVVPRSDCVANKKPVGATMKMIICTMNVRGSVNPILNSENSFAAMSKIAISDLLFHFNIFMLN